MKKKARYIAVEGPIGVGKSTLVTLLAEKSGVERIYEKVDENPFLEKFYEDKCGNAFQTQIFFLLSRYKQLCQFSQVDLFNTTVLCDYIFERDLVFAQINLSDDEYRLYMEIYALLQKKLPQPDLVVYLQAETSTLVKRVRQRGRAVESFISEEYLEKVNRAFNDFFFNYSSGPLLIINTDRIDFVNDSADLDKLIDKITGDVRGREFFNPLGSSF